jgi:hypothetical protein
MSSGEISSNRLEVGSQVQVKAAGGLASQPIRITVPLAGLSLRLRTGERPSLQQLTIALEDLQIPADVLPPRGLGLRELQLSIDEPTRATILHAQDDAIELQASAPLRLDWSMVLEDGSLYRLGPAFTEPVKLEVQVVRSADGAVSTILQARCEGTCWTLDGIAQLSDGTIDLVADATVNPR